MEFTYSLPYSENKLLEAALKMIDEEWSALLKNCRMTLEDNGLSYYYDKAKNSRWDATRNSN